VAVQLGDNPFGNRRRGVDEIWRMAERDIEEQEALYAAEESCIIVELE
jgi:hypothetical protein